MSDAHDPSIGEKKMTYQEILEGITRHRADPAKVTVPDNIPLQGFFDVGRKLDEIEWALQAIAEKLAAGDKT